MYLASFASNIYFTIYRSNIWDLTQNCHPKTYVKYRLITGNKLGCRVKEVFVIWMGVFVMVLNGYMTLGQTQQEITKDLRMLAK